MNLLSQDDYLGRISADSSLPACECPICFESATDPTKTICNHIFCLECLRKWLISSHTCPACRCALYASPLGKPTSGTNERESDDSGEEDSFDPRRIEHLPLPFHVSDNAVNEVLIRLNDFSDLEDQHPRRDLVYVHYEGLLPTAIGLILWHKPDSTNDFTSHCISLCRQEWLIVANAIQEVLHAWQGLEITYGQLWDALDIEIHFRLQRIGTPRPLYVQNAPSWFIEDIWEVLRGICHEAHFEYYTLHPEIQQDLHRELPVHITDLDLPHVTNDDDMIDAVEDMISNGPPSQLPDDIPIYINYPHLLPISSAALHYASRLGRWEALAIHKIIAKCLSKQHGSFTTTHMLLQDLVKAFQSRGHLLESPRQRESLEGVLYEMVAKATRLTEAQIGMLGHSTGEVAVEEMDESW